MESVAATAIDNDDLDKIDDYRRNKPLRIWEPFNANVTDHDAISEKNPSESDDHAEPAEKSRPQTNKKPPVAASDKGKKKYFKGTVKGPEGLIPFLH